MRLCVFEVGTQLRGHQTLFGSLWASYKIIAKDAEDAIRLAKKKMSDQEYVISVHLITDLD